MDPGNYKPNQNNHPQQLHAQQPQKKKMLIVAVSDTHGHYKKLNSLLSMKGDIFIHAGDFTYYGKDGDFAKFFEFLDKLQFRHKIVISGNHQISLDNGCINPHRKAQYLKKHPCKWYKEELLVELKKRCIYLQHQYINIEGVKIFASPYTPDFCGNAFQYQEKDEHVIWDAIPSGLDILVTHGPPFGILDLNSEGTHAGSQYLRTISLQRKPKYHIFGHIHQAVGIDKIHEIMYVNVANEPTKLFV